MARMECPAAMTRMRQIEEMRGSMCVEVDRPTSWE